MIDYVADDNWASINPSDIPAGGYTSLARLAWGGFVIIEGRQGGISAEIFDDAGKPAGTVQKIPGAANGFAAGLSDGGFVITWDASDDSLNGVFVQRFTAQGQPIGGAIAVNQVTSGSQQPYSAIGFADGGFAVSWTSSNTNTVAVRLFSANATAQGDEIVLATSPTFGKYSPRLAAWDDGRFVATWAGSFDSQGGDTVYAQVLNRDGTRVGPEIRIANFPHDGHGNSYNAVAALDNGNFVMTWTRRDYAPNGGALDQVWAQVFNHSGQSIGSAFQVNAPSIYRSYLGQVSALGDGFIVVWQDDNPAFGPNFSDRGDVHARIYDASGNAIGAEFIVNETLERGQSQPLVTQFGTDDFAIAWSQTIATGDSVR